jgi:hypothetical protein
MGTVAILFALALPSLGNAADPPNIEPLLVEGKLEAAEKELTRALTADPDDEQSRFGLGATQFLRSIERLAQALHRYGLRDNLGVGVLPGGRVLPIPKNQHPEKVKLADVRAALQILLDDLKKSEATLAKVNKPETKLRWRLGLIRLDLDGDGRTSPSDSLQAIYAIPRNAARSADSGGIQGDAAFAFDRGDAAWLRGYCHILMAMVEAILAHDGTELFEKTGHVLFANVDSPYAFLGKGASLFSSGRDGADFADIIAMIHLTRFPVSEPKRLAVARDHLKATISLSRVMWTWIGQESDNDHEWIPNPSQDTAVPGGKVTEVMIKGWHEFLDEADKLLDGTKLVPFWRGDGAKGINLKRVLLEPREFDLVLWVQGSAAVPYLEPGDITNRETWRRFQELYRGNFFGFALWFN